MNRARHGSQGGWLALTLRKKIPWRDPCDPFLKKKIVLAPAKRVSPRIRLIERFLMTEDTEWSGLSWERTMELEWNLSDQ